MKREKAKGYAYSGAEVHMGKGEKLNWSPRLPDLGRPRGFFAYPSSPPSIPPTIMAAIDSINSTQSVEIKSWEELSVSGQYIIDEICRAIDEADFFCADVTGINANVMFELGYAIATDKRTWLIRDDSYTDVKKEYEQLRVLTTVGFSSYKNSGQIIASFFTDNPHLLLRKTIWQQSIEPVLAKQTTDGHVLYLKNRHETEASIKVSRALEDSKVPLTNSDPKETSIRPAYWYAQQLWEALGLVAHFASSAREGYRIHNARYALVAGMAHGFSVPTLILTEQSDLLAPIDYRDAMKSYITPLEAAELVNEWLLPIKKEEHVVHTIHADRVRSLMRATELKDFHLQLGDFVAEDEAQQLDAYFVETTVSADIANGTQSVFVGRKGMGKTANLIHAESIIGSNPQNLVCLIKPVGYEIEGLVRLFATYKARDYKGYVIESLWKYMIYTEVARAAAQQIDANAIWQLAEPDARELVDLLEDEKQAFSGDFAVRLERMVNLLSSVPVDESGELFRKGISETLHSGALAKLRMVLGRVLSKKKKVILLVDNLDKSWTKSADLEQLAEFLLGLLTATKRVGEELNRAERGRQASAFSSAIFLRSDIFEKVLAAAREPDKLSYTRLRWDDEELLLRVIEERYVASHGPESDPAVMWHKYFCPQVGGVPTREYLVRQILKRPRDIVFLVKSAVSFAVNRKHDRVEEKDILDAEKEYAQYALDSILVENGISIPQLEEVLFQFSGSSAIITEIEARQIVSRAADFPVEKVDYAVEHLLRLSFLGIETSSDVFAFSEESRELKKNKVLGEKFISSSGQEKRFEIGRAFRAYLEVV
jgi:nucleoside 2-deoxyribosyltransferase